MIRHSFLIHAFLITPDALPPPAPRPRPDRRCRAASELRLHPHRRHGPDGSRLLRVEVLRDAADRPAGGGRAEVHAGLQRMHGVLTDARLAAHRAVSGAAASHGLDRGPRAALRPAARAGLAEESEAGMDHATGAAPRRGLRDGDDRQVASRRRRAERAWLRREHRRHAQGPAAVVFLPLQNPHAARWAGGRVPQRPAHERGGEVDRAEQGAPVLPLPAALRRAYAARRKAGRGGEIQSQGRRGGPAAQRGVCGARRERGR